MTQPPTFLAAALAAALLAGCSVSGPPELPFAPPAVDMHADLGVIGVGTALVAPAGWGPAPTLVSPIFRAPAPGLFDAMRQVLLAEPRTWLVAAHPEQQQATFIVRSLVMNFPDAVVVQAVPVSATTSQAVIFSQSRYDVMPLLVSENQARVQRVVAALRARLGTVAGPSG